VLEVVFLEELLPLSLFLLDLKPELPVALFDFLTDFVDPRFESHLFVPLGDG